MRAPTRTPNRKPFAGGLSAADWVLSGALGVLACWFWPCCRLTLRPAAPATSIRQPARTFRGRGILVPAAAAAAAITFLAGAYFKKRIGGYTGDCLGAAQQLAELAFLLAALAS